MKKEIIFLLFLLMILANMPALAQKDVDGSVILPRNKENKINRILGLQEIPKIKVEYDSVRPLKEINEPNIADANPWISPDGLRLYYYKLFQSKYTKIFYAERKSILDTFSNIHALSINFEDYDNISPWLTNDELNIYFICSKPSDSAYYSLYHSSRNKANDEFSEPTLVKFNVQLSGFFWGHSFTQDKFQLYIYNENGLNNNILIFNKKNEDEYDINDSLIIPDGYTVGPGQLTKDDLKYYLSLQDSSGKRLISYFERKQTSDSFDSLYYMDNNLVNDTNFNNFYPSLSENENILVFTRNIFGDWEGNDLYIAYKTPTSVHDYNSLSDNSISAYPNPFSDKTIIKYELTEPAFVKINLYNTLGNKINIIEKFLDAGEHQEIINAENEPQGIYYYTIQTGQKIVSGKLLLIK
jgi:hypothetical protein